MAIIYMGSLDDRVYHFHWTFSKLTLKSYLNSMLQNTIIGHKSAINDGYFLANPILRNSLFINKSSILKDLLATGEIIIPGRKSSFTELIDEQINHGIASFEQIPADVLKQINDVDNEVNHSKARVSGPESMSIWSGFFDLMASLRERPFEDLGISRYYLSDYDFKIALDSFLTNSSDTKPASRTQWETILTEFSNKHAGNGGFVAGKHTKFTLMNLGNEAYHYNFAKQLSKHLNLRVDVETVNTPAFSHLLEEKYMDIGTMTEDLPLLEIPRINNLLKRNSVELLLDINSTIGQARDEFLKSLKNFESNANDKSLKELKYKAAIYNELLDSEFGKPDLVQNIASAANFTLSMSAFVGSLAFGSTGLTPTIMIALLSWGVADAGSRIITNKFITERPRKIDYKKYRMTASKIKGT